MHCHAVFWQKTTKRSKSFENVVLSRNHGLTCTAMAIWANNHGTEKIVGKRGFKLKLTSFLVKFNDFLLSVLFQEIHAQPCFLLAKNHKIV